MNLFNKAENETDYDIRDDYFNDGANANLQDQQVKTDNMNHRLNTKLEWDVNAANHLMIRPSLLYQRQIESSSLKISEEDHSSLDITDLMSQKQHTSQEAINSSNEIMYIHRFRNVGSSISMNIKIIAVQ